MKITLDMEADVLNAVCELARHRGLSVGEVMSDLVRRALSDPNCRRQDNQNTTPEIAYVTGFEPFPATGSIVTNDLIDRLRDADGV